MQSIKAKALSLLARKNYFSKELKKKLLEKGYPPSEVEELILEFTKKKWLNDRDLAFRFVEREREKGQGAKLIALKLQEKAGKMDIPIQESEEAVLRLIKRRYLKDLPQNREKVIRALMRKGISYELINKTLDSISLE